MQPLAFALRPPGMVGSEYAYNCCRGFFPGNSYRSASFNAGGFPSHY